MITLVRYIGPYSAPSVVLPAPTLVMEWVATRSSGTIIHTLIGGGISATHRPAAYRRSRLKFLYPLEADAKKCVAEHARGGVFRVEHEDRDSINMTYAVYGEISCTLDPETADVWIVEVDAQEVIL